MSSKIVKANSLDEAKELCPWAVMFQVSSSDNKQWICTRFNTKTI